MPRSFSKFINEIHACTLCKDQLPHTPNPVLQAHPDAKILIAGQAPGIRVHKSGIPFNDPSGDRLREWLGIDRETFYDPKKVAIIPMGFCYPGTGKSGDLPPIPLCAQTWRQRLLDQLSNIQLTLLIGQYAQHWHLPDNKLNLTDTVKAWKSFAPDIIPLPHPSPRNNIWLKKNPWFEKEVLPHIKMHLQKLGLQ